MNFTACGDSHSDESNHSPCSEDAALAWEGRTSPQKSVLLGAPHAPSRFLGAASFGVLPDMTSGASSTHTVALGASRLQTQLQALPPTLGQVSPPASRTSCHPWTATELDVGMFTAATRSLHTTQKKCEPWMSPHLGDISSVWTVSNAYETVLF